MNFPHAIMKEGELATTLFFNESQTRLFSLKVKRAETDRACDPAIFKQKGQ